LRARCRQLALLSSCPEAIIIEAPLAEPKQVKRAVKAYVTKQKKRSLTKKEYDALMLLIALFSLIVAIYSAIQQGGTVNNIRIVYPPGSEQVAKQKWYRLQRSCQLKTGPTFKSATVGVIPAGTRLEVIFVNHQWLYVEYQPDGEEIPKYGYVNKKYLKREN
jgi:uncharacterized protein YgiM (DUF1202 family)